MNERTHLLHEIQKLSFAVTEVALYLDGHPNDREALAYYHENNAQKITAVEAYESKYGPLTITGNRSDTTWQWACTPWPWEEE